MNDEHPVRCMPLLPTAQLEIWRPGKQPHLLCRTLVDTPFPFAWAQAASGLLLLCALGLPFHMAATAAGAAGAAVSAGLVVLVCAPATAALCRAACCVLRASCCNMILRHAAAIGCMHGRGDSWPQVHLH